MKEKWKTLILSIIICIVAGAIGLGIKNLYHHIKFQKIYNSILKEGTSDVLFLGRPTCGFCNLFKPVLEETSKNYNIKYRYINTDWFTKKELDKILEKLEIRKSTFSTPRLIITENTKIKDHYIGYMDDISLFHFLKKNELIASEQQFVDPYPNVERLSSSDYFNLLEEKKSVTILVGRIGDQNVDEILKKANEKQNGLKFLSPSIFTTKEESKKFTDSLTGLKEDMLLPLLVEIKNGEVKNIIEQAKVKDIEE